MVDVSIPNVLTNLVGVLALTVATVFVFQKLKLPSVIGFLVVGIITGPYGLDLVGHAADLELLAEIGIVLLLFSIGIEFSIERLLSFKKLVLIGGCLQVLLTVVVVAALSFYLGYPARIGLFLGMLASLSSTAIVLKIYSDQEKLAAPHGQLATGILLLQDIMAVPMMLSIPVLGQEVPFSATVLAWTLGKSILAVTLIVLASRFAVPWLLYQVARLRNREIFVLFVLLICLGTAWLAFQSGISLALGAFVAGLLISDSEYSHQVISDIHPLRDSVAGIFFISIGMQVNLPFVLSQLSFVAGAWGVLVLIKGGLILGIFSFLRRSFRLGLSLGLALAQVGEFSLILARMGRALGLLAADQEQLFLATAILSMLMTPLFIFWGDQLAFALDRQVGARSEGMHAPPADSGHVIIVGYGLNGRNLSRVLREVEIPHRIVDLNPEVARTARAAGEPVIFGDATRQAVLASVGVRSARVLVVAITDPVATARIVQQTRQTNAGIYIIVRTRYVAEINNLHRLGANEVIPEEFETSVEIFARVLHEYHIPRNLITLQVELIRKEGYGMLRGLRLEGKSLARVSQFLVGATADTFLVQQGSAAEDYTVEDLQRSFGSGTSVLAVVRNRQSFATPASEFQFQAGDIVVLMGSHQDLDRAVQLLSTTTDSEESGS